METRSKRAWSNISTGLIYKVLMLLMSFAVRSVFTWTLGLEYLGLNSLFSSILNVLNLAELGFAGALVASMYEPFAKHDVKKVNALLRIYKISYRVIGSIIIIIGVGITPFIPSLITGGYPENINLYLLYWINLAGVGVTYFLFAYKSCILTVAQRSDIGNVVHIILMIIQYAIQFWILIVYKNYYMYLLVLPIINVLFNIITAYIATKLFPEFRCEGNIDIKQQKNIEKKIAGLALGKVSNALCNGLDSIVISMFIGLVALGKYNLYYYVYSALNAILYVIISSMISSVGNSMALCDITKNLNNFKRIDFIWDWLITWFTACLICLYQPFIELWQGKNAMFGDDVMIVFCLYFFSQHIAMPVQLYKDAAGLWWEDRWRVVVEGGCNLSLNIILVQFLGIVGVLLSTVITLLLISFPWQSAVLFKNYFRLAAIDYLLYQIKRLIIAICICALTFAVAKMLFENFSGVTTLVLRGTFVMIFPNIALYFVWHKTTDFSEAEAFAKGILEKLLRKSA